MSRPFIRSSKRSVKRHSLLAVVFISTVLLLAHHLWACEVMLRWDPNVEPELAGYMIYWGTASGEYSESIDVGNQTDYTIPALENGETFFIAVTAYDELGFESDFSNEVSVTPDCQEARPPR